MSSRQLNTMSSIHPLIQSIGGGKALFYSDKYSLDKMCEIKYIDDIISSICVIDEGWFDKNSLMFVSAEEENLSKLNIDLSEFIILMFSDEAATYPEWTANNAKIVFKSYLNRYRPTGNVFPLPLGCVHDVPEPQDPSCS